MFWGYSQRVWKVTSTCSLQKSEIKELTSPKWSLVLVLCFSPPTISARKLEKMCLAFLFIHPHFPRSRLWDAVIIVFGLTRLRKKNGRYATLLYDPQRVSRVPTCFGCTRSGSRGCPQRVLRILATGFAVLAACFEAYPQCVLRPPAACFVAESNLLL